MTFSNALRTFIRGGIQALNGLPISTPRASNVRTFGTDGNGLTLDELFLLSMGQSITYDDVIVLPRFVERPTPVHDVDLRVELAPGLLCNPVVSSPMDTVTEWRMAVQMALNGCLGVLHINLGVDDMIEQVRRVKRFQMGFIWDPVSLPADALVRDAREAQRQNGYSTFPITTGPNGTGKFVGLVTRNCIDALETDDRRLLGDVMLPLDKLLIGESNTVKTLDEAKALFHAHPDVSKLPILNRDGSLHALINRKNVVASQRYPYTLTDSNHQLRVGAAVSTHPSDDVRVQRLVEAGVDVIVIDSSQGGTNYAVRRIHQIKNLSPTVIIIAGNVVTPAQSAPLYAAGANAVRVGMGSGSICITQGQYGLGRGQASAVYHVGEGTIADGGVRSSGDAFKALCLGANAVMLGNYLAGCDEAPGELVLYKGQRFRTYQGMGSKKAMAARGAERYGGSAGNNDARIVEQGISGMVPACGPLDDRLGEMLWGIRGAMSQHGLRNIGELRAAVRAGSIRFELRSPAAVKEGNVHDMAQLPAG